MNLALRMELSALFLIFLVLKLCHVIHWSWWWVTLPIWLPILLAVSGMIILFSYYFIYRIINYANNRKKTDRKASSN